MALELYTQPAYSKANAQWGERLALARAAVRSQNGSAQALLRIQEEVLTQMVEGPDIYFTDPYNNHSLLTALGLGDFNLYGDSSELNEQLTGLPAGTPADEVKAVTAAYIALKMAQHNSAFTLFEYFAPEGRIEGDKLLQFRRVVASKRRDILGNLRTMPLVKELKHFFGRHDLLLHILDFAIATKQYIEVDA